MLLKGALRENIRGEKVNTTITLLTETEYGGGGDLDCAFVSWSSSSSQVFALGCFGREGF